MEWDGIDWLFVWMSTYLGFTYSHWFILWTHGRIESMAVGCSKDSRAKLQSAAAQANRQMRTFRFELSRTSPINKFRRD